MNRELKAFLDDLIIILQEKYNDSLTAVESDNKEDRAFRQGCNFAYYDVLDIIELQLDALGLKDNIPHQITPTLGQEIKTRDKIRDPHSP